MSRNSSFGRGLWKLLKAPLFMARGIKYHAAGRFYVPKPKKFYLILTDRCNARCPMCSFWKKTPGREPTLEEIRRIFSNPLLDRLETVVLSGGEPTLRDDLPQVAQTILSANASVKYLYLITNALDPVLVRKSVEGILALTQYPRLKEFTVVVSLDGVGAVHDGTRGVPQAFNNVSESLRRLQKMRHDPAFRLILNCTVLRSNAADVHRMSAFAREMDLPITFHPLNIKVSDARAYREEQLLSQGQLADLKALFKDKVELRSTDAALWQDYFRIRGGKKRRLPCASPDHTVFMTAQGDLYVCAIYDQVKPEIYGNVYRSDIDQLWYSQKAKAARRRVKKHFCSGCENLCEASFSLNLEVFYFARYLISERMTRVFRQE